jgi:hypothetical protein
MDPWNVIKMYVCMFNSVQLVLGCYSSLHNNDLIFHFVMHNYMRLIVLHICISPHGGIYIDAHCTILNIIIIIIMMMMMNIYLRAVRGSPNLLG